MNMLNRTKVFGALAATAVVLAACATPTPPPAPTKAPEPTKAPAPAQPTAAPPPTAAPAPTAVPPTKAPEPTKAPAPAEVTELVAPGYKADAVPRNKKLILGWGLERSIGNSNPWAAGYTHQAGNAFLWEPLFYFGIFEDKEKPWLAESGTYNKDFTELTIKLRKDAKWNDGTPVTANDVKFTADGQRTNEKLNYNSEFKEFVKEVKVVDDQTAVFVFNKPAPRFKFEVLSLKFDTGIPIVPAHILSKEKDPNAFAGGITMPSSGAYKLVYWSKETKVYDADPNWWAIKAGVAKAPEAQRIQMYNLNDVPGEKRNQLLVNNDLDAALDVRDADIASIIQKNPKFTSHTGNNAPRGYLDWWPNSLWMNHQAEPYNDVRVRKAMALSINRDQIDQVVYSGAKISTVYPFPLYPGLNAFANSDGMKAVIQKYNPRNFSLAESAKLMTEAGWAKNSKGLWEKGGKTVDATIKGFEGIHADIVPVLVEQLKAGGFDAKIDFGPEAYNDMAGGKPGLYMFGHGASLKDPYAVLFLFTKKPAGNTAGANNFSRYNNPEFDKIVSQMGPMDASDPKFQELAVQAFDIYYKDVIDIPIIQWLHRIPYNQTYWTNWPTAANVGPGVNGAFWAHTGALVVQNLKAAQ